MEAAKCNQKRNYEHKVSSAHKAVIIEKGNC